MGVVSPSDDELEFQAPVIEQDEDEHGAQWFTRLQKWHAEDANHALVHTALDSHRRDMFASYPLTAGRPSMESIDECKGAASVKERSKFTDSRRYSYPTTRGAVLAYHS